VRPEDPSRETGGREVKEKLRNKRWSWLIALVCVGAVMPSSAVAAQFHSESSPVKLVGTGPLFNSEHYLRVSNQKNKTVQTECNNNAYYGEMLGTSFSTAILSPNWGACKVAGMTMVMNAENCHFEISPVFGGATSGTFGIKCPEGQSVKLVQQECTITFSSQAGLSGVTFTNFGAGNFRGTIANLKVEKITYEIRRGCPNQVTTEIHSDGRLWEEVSFEGQTKAGARQGLWIE
jgi:hypothetical protein